MCSLKRIFILGKIDCKPPTEHTLSGSILERIKHIFCITAATCKIVKTPLKCRNSKSMNCDPMTRYFISWFITMINIFFIRRGLTQAMLCHNQNLANRRPIFKESNYTQLRESVRVQSLVLFQHYGLIKRCSNGGDLMQFIFTPFYFRIILQKVKKCCVRFGLSKEGQNLQAPYFFLTRPNPFNQCI